VNNRPNMVYDGLLLSFSVVKGSGMEAQGIKDSFDVDFGTTCHIYPQIRML
jgi:hypothetical protein